MRRDMDLIRKLLLKIEEIEITPGSNIIIKGNEDEILIDGYEVSEIKIHLHMIFDGGLISGEDLGFGLKFTGLSWAGHDFIDSVRDEGIWKRTKETARKAGGFTSGILVEIAKNIITNDVTKFLSF